MNRLLALAISAIFAAGAAIAQPSGSRVGVTAPSGGVSDVQVLVPSTNTWSTIGRLNTSNSRFSGAGGPSISVTDYGIVSGTTDNYSKVAAMFTAAMPTLYKRDGRTYLQS